MSCEPPDPPQALAGAEIFMLHSLLLLSFGNHTVVFVELCFLNRCKSLRKGAWSLELFVVCRRPVCLACLGLHRLLAHFGALHLPREGMNSMREHSTLIALLEESLLVWTAHQKDSTPTRLDLHLQVK